MTEQFRLEIGPNGELVYRVRFRRPEPIIEELALLASLRAPVKTSDAKEDE